MLSRRRDARAAGGLRGNFARFSIRLIPEIGLGRILRGERLVINADMAAESGLFGGDPIPPRYGRYSWGTQLCFRWRCVKDDALLGAFTFYRKEIRAIHRQSRSLSCRTSLLRP